MEKRYFSSKKKKKIDMSRGFDLWNIYFLPELKSCTLADIYLSFHVINKNKLWKLAYVGVKLKQIYEIGILDPIVPGLLPSRSHSCV